MFLSQTPLCAHQSQLQSVHLRLNHFWLCEQRHSLRLNILPVELWRWKRCLFRRSLNTWDCFSSLNTAAHNPFNLLGLASVLCRLSVVDLKPVPVFFLSTAQGWHVAQGLPSYTRGANLHHWVWITGMDETLTTHQAHSQMETTDKLGSN